MPENVQTIYIYITKSPLYSIKLSVFGAGKFGDATFVSIDEYIIAGDRVVDW